MSKPGDVKKILGYEVLKNDHPRSNIVYYLRNEKRVYGLVRCPNKDNIYYATNAQGRSCYINGYKYFTDRKGRLEVLIDVVKL